MQNQNHTGDRPPLTGRSYNAYVTGSSPQELETSALNQARIFFGDNAKLWVSPEYVASAKGIGDEAIYEGDGTHCAAISVHEIAQEV